jgi:transcription elongation factor Elf1
VTSFTCSICGEESTRICVRCTKDACANHLCDKCGRCSDCCECEVALEEPSNTFTPVSQALRQPKPEPDAEPEPEPPNPPPEVESFPEDEPAPGL